MGGHVNMMDDVLISNLSPELLRSSLRLLVSQGATTQQPFVQHIQQQFLASPPSLPSPVELFPPEVNDNGEKDGAAASATAACEQYLAVTRCIFSCKMVDMALTYLAHFIDAIPRASATWTEGSHLASIMEKAGGDVVQAVQAVKEAAGPNPQPSQDLKIRLTTLATALAVCRSYCAASKHVLVFPFTRADRQVRDVIGFLGLEQLVGPEKEVRDATALTLDLSRPSRVETFKLGSLEKVPRLFNGLWQLSSPAWGSSTAEKQHAALGRLVESHLLAADMADHYGDAELIYGDFRNSLPKEISSQVFAATKWCVFGSGPPSPQITRDWVLSQVQERSRRLGGGRVELLQFHWHDYGSKSYLPILSHLVSITQTNPELVSQIGLCNFDAEHTAEICEYLQQQQQQPEHGGGRKVGIVSNQVQFSLVDSRPLQKMCHVCAKYGLKLLTYGSICGGFLSEKWLNRPTPPEAYSAEDPLTPSQRKYMDMIGHWGGWEAFQSLLRVLAAQAEKKNKKKGAGKEGIISITNVATRWVLQQPAVGAVIVGTRLGVSAREDENLGVFDEAAVLSDEDMEEINAVALRGPGGEDRTAAVFDKLGDCGNEYRAMH